MNAHEAGAMHADVRNRAPAWLRQPADINQLLAPLWPANVARADSGALTIAGHDVRDLAAEFGTPAYILDEADFRDRCRAFKAGFPDADVFYAGKAFLSKAVVRWIAEEGLNLDVCTGGELAVALAADFPAERIGLHGNNKSISELTRALDAGVGRIIVDSEQEIARLAELARERGVRARVMIRVNVGVEAHTHEYIATAHEDQKFGFALAGGVAAAAVAQVLASDSLELIGLHSHIGSQIFDTQGFEVSARRVVGLHTQIRDWNGVELPELDLGGGFGIAYTSPDDPLSPAELGTRLRKIVEAECAASRISVPRLSIEPGRAIVGPSVFTLYEVGTVKPLPGLRTYVSVDGGMSDNIRTALYDASYSCALANRRTDAEPILVRVVGKHCESGDLVVRDEFLPADVAPGDLIAVPATGAYCRSMASNYNYVPRPPVIAVGEGDPRVIIRRETEDDLLALDVG